MNLIRRTEEARLLAGRLTQQAGSDALVLAASRNAIPLARALARELGCGMDIVLLSDFGPGTISESGEILWKLEGAGGGWNEEAIAGQIVRAFEGLLAERGRYSAQSAAADPAGRTVIVVADGLAAGTGFVNVLRAVRARGPNRLIAAVGATTPAALRRVKPEADRVIALEVDGCYSEVARTLAASVALKENRTVERVTQDLQARA